MNLLEKEKQWHTAIFSRYKNGELPTSDLIKLTTDIFPTNSNYYINQALSICLAHGLNDLADELDKNGARMPKNSGKDDSILFILTSSGERPNASAVDWLIRHGYARDPVFHGTGGLYPLHLCSLGGHLDVAKVLVSHGADINTQMLADSRATPLMLAAEKGHYDFVKWLLSLGARQDYISKEDGKTAREMAAPNVLPLFSDNP